MNKIPQNTIVILDIKETSLYYDFIKYYEDLLGIENGQSVLCLGEISNMPEHYIIVGKNNKISWGLHSDVFRIPTQEEL